MVDTMKPFSEIRLVGSCGYQIFTNTYRGEVRHISKVGFPRENKDTGEWYIVPWMKAESRRDFLAAAEYADKELEELQNAAFREKTSRSAASVTPLQPMTEEETDATTESSEPLELKLANG